MGKKSCCEELQSLLSSWPWSYLLSQPSSAPFVGLSMTRSIDPCKEQW